MLPALQDPSFSEARATRLILDQIADKWSIMILVFLCEKQAQRFSAIKRRLGGITQKSLTQALRRLERNGLLTRRVIAASPIAVAYALTPLATSLKNPFAALYAWSIDHRVDIERAQSCFDERAQESGAEFQPVATSSSP